MSTVASPSPPFRLIGRRMTGFLTGATAELAKPHGGDLTQTLAFTTVACANVSHLPYAAPGPPTVAHGLDSPEGLRRPVSVNAVARSLGLPFETVRLRIHRLEAAGLCRRAAGGVSVPASALARPEIAGAWLAAHAALLDRLGELQRAGVDLDALARQIDDGPPLPEAPPPFVVVRIALDSVLRVLERFASAFGSLSRGYLFAAIASANTRHLDEPPHPPLAYAYPDTPPPDGLRQPVSVRGMARELGLPVETTRRNAERLTAEGWLAPGRGGGLIVPAAAFETPMVSALSQAVALNTVRMLMDLRRAGLRFDERD